MRLIVWTILAFSVTASAGAAQTPQEIIRWLYVSLLNEGPLTEKGLDFLSAPAQRETYFSDRMVAFYAAGGASSNCVDYGFAIPGNEFDAGEIVQSLRISASENARGGLTVQADFTTLGEAARVDYDFTAEDGFWKIDDIAGAGFRVSQIECIAQKSPPPSASAAYCYKNGEDVLRLDVFDGGRAHLDFISWQGNFHTCSADISGQQVAGGWDFHEAQGCVIQLRVVASGLQLGDPGWACKPMMCGQRAVIDGINFPVATQIDCASWSDVRR